MTGSVLKTKTVDYTKNFEYSSFLYKRDYMDKNLL